MFLRGRRTLPRQLSLINLECSVNINKTPDARDELPIRVNQIAATNSRDYVPAAEALRMLEIRHQTLYAYVSRGWIRSTRQPGRNDRLYLREDIERMRTRARARSGHGAVAASAMNWGEPIIPTSITEIKQDGPWYRGRPAVQLARSSASFEAVAELLWSGLWHEEPLRWSVAPLPADVRALAGSITRLRSNDQLLEIFALFILKLGVSRGSIADRVRSGRTLDAAREIIQALTGCFGYISARARFVVLRNGQSVVEGLLRSLALADTGENREALQAMLILFADHELSPGAFAARVAASAGATVHSCVASAICTSSGVHIGRLYDRVEEFLAGAPTKAALLRRARECQERGTAVPGFGHPLYPRGDPRALFLLELAQRRARQTKRMESVFGFVNDAQTKLGLFPRHELAAVTLAIAMGMPARSAGALFTLSRTAGWVAHVQEQRLSGTLLRPRARFVAP
jgi:citrate synthase